MMKQNISRYSFELSGYFLLVALFVLLNLYLVGKANHIQVELNIDTEKSSVFQIFWRQKDSPYENKKSVLIETHPDRSVYFFKMPSFANFDLLRIDPVNNMQSIHITKFHLQHVLYKSITIFPQESEIALTNINQLKTFEQSKGNGLYIVSAGNDPYFEINIVSFLDMKILYLLIVLVIVGTFLLYILLNQRLLKGSKNSAIILLIIPRHEKTLIKELFLEVLKKKCPGTRLISIQSQLEADKYLFDCPVIENSILLIFLKEIRKMSHEIECHIHYNRPGEI